MEVAALVKFLLVIAHTGLHQHLSNLVLALHRLTNRQIAASQRSPPFSDLARGHVGLREKIAPQTIGEFAGIHAIILLLGRRNLSQHERMCYLHCRCQRQ
jgi:hypothetical protein